MSEPDRAQLVAVLDELRDAVDADAGAELYAGDGDGVMHLVASASGTRRGQQSPMQLLRSRLGSSSDDAEGHSLVLAVPGTVSSVVVLARHGRRDFTQQDSTLARLYLRRLAVARDFAGQTHSHGWTRQLEAIQRIAARLTRLATLEEVGAAICSETGQVIDFDEAHVLIVTGHDGSGQSVLQPVAVAGATVATEMFPLLDGGSASEAIFRAAHGGAAVLASDLPDMGPGRAGSHSLLAVPLNFEDRVSGVICLIARGVGRFDDDDLRLLQILSDQAAVAVENARLLSGREQVVQELAVLLEVSQTASAATDELELVRVLADRTRFATATDAAIVSRWDEDSTMLREVWRDGVSGPAMAIDVAQSPRRRSVLSDGRPVVVQADSSDPSPEAQQLRSAGGRTWICLPLTAGGRPFGIVELLSFTSERNPDPAAMQAAETMASLCATGLEKIRLLEQLRSAADIDLVTGVHNHRYLQERLRQEVARSARSHSPFAVLMLDLDKFKPINDRFGHADGDVVLSTVGATIRAQVRASDIVARYGGDEFVVLMPDTPPNRAEQVARRVVDGILGCRHVMSDGSHVAVGVSAGLAIYPTDGRTSAQLLQVSDAAMYSAKRSGQPQVLRSAATQQLGGVAAAAVGG